MKPISQEELKRRMLQCGGVSPDDAENEAVMALLERAERAEGALRELLDRSGEGIGHKFESWEMAAFLRELRSEIHAALSPEPWGGPEGEE